jgi:hypothetical protein
LPGLLVGSVGHLLGKPPVCALLAVAGALCCRGRAVSPYLLGQRPHPRGLARNGFPEGVGFVPGARGESV